LFLLALSPQLFTEYIAIRKPVKTAVADAPAVVPDAGDAADPVPPIPISLDIVVYSYLFS